MSQAELFQEIMLPQVLRELGETACREIAAVTGAPSSTVMSHLSPARKEAAS